MPYIQSYYIYLEETTDVEHSLAKASTEVKVSLIMTNTVVFFPDINKTFSFFMFRGRHVISVCDHINTKGFQGLVPGHCRETGL